MRSILESFTADAVRFGKNITGKDAPQDQYDINGVEYTLFRKGTPVKHTVTGLTASEAQDRINSLKADPKAWNKLDLEARRKIVNTGGETTAKKSIPDKIDDVKVKAGEIAAKTGETVSKASKTAYDHIASNLPAYGGAAVAGLGAYGLYKYLKNKKKKS